MKILIIRNFPSYMTVKNNTYNIQEIGLAKGLIRLGHICDIVFWTNGKEECIKYAFDQNKSLNVYYRKGKTALKNTILNVDDLIPQYDIVQLCEYNQIQSWLFSKRYASKTVIYHGPYYSEFNKNYNRMCKVFDLLFLNRYKKLATHFIVKSTLAEEFLKKKGIVNIKTLGVGVDRQMLISDKVGCGEHIYNALINDKENVKLLYIGRIEERRNIKFLIDILETLLKHINAHLYIIGDGESDYVSEVQLYISSKHLNENITWQKKLEQKYMASIYQNTDYFLLPTHYEIFGMVLLESMYYENCVLTTYNGGSATIINNGDNGFILSENNVDEWVTTIIKIENDKSYRSNICKNAKATIEEGFTWDKLAIKFANIYEEVIAHNESIND